MNSDRRRGRRWRVVAGVVSTVLSLLLVEIAIRLVTLHPISSKSNLMPDPVLGYRMDTRIADVDAAGFRNPSVLTEARLVTIGDSHTYGFSADSVEAWPRVLADDLGLTVYNFGIGGFGILQYQELLDRALELKPDWLIVGLYLPNDLHDVTKCRTDLDLGCAWASERGFPAPERRTFFQQGFRTTLARQLAIGSVISQIATPYFPTAESMKADVLTVDHPRNPNVFRLSFAKSIADQMDLNRPSIRAGQKLFENFFERAKRASLRADTKLLVLLIPSRQFVYVEHLAENLPKLPSEFQVLARNEHQLKSNVESTLARLDVPFIDAAPYLRRAIREVDGVYGDQGRDHPAAAGYRVYAQAARDLLNADALE